MINRNVFFAKAGYNKWNERTEYHQDEPNLARGSWHWVYFQVWTLKSNTWPWTTKNWSSQFGIPRVMSAFVRWRVAITEAPKASYLVRSVLLVYFQVKQLESLTGAKMSRIVVGNLIVGASSQTFRSMSITCNNQHSFAAIGISSCECGVSTFVRSELCH